MSDIKIESLDVMKVQREINLLFDELCDLNERAIKLPVYPPLGWLWCFNILQDIFDNHQNQETNDEVIAEGVTLKQIFDKFYQDIDSLGLDMELGGDILDEVIRDWMIDNDFLVYIEEGAVS